MESENYETLVPHLVEAIPEVPFDPDDVADRRTYLVFNDLMRFVVSSIDAGKTETLERIFRFIEAAAQTNDLRVEDVLQDAFYHVAVAPKETTERAKNSMGPRTQKLFRRVEAQIYQR